MFKKKLLDLYNSAGINSSEANAELNMIFDYLGISPNKLLLGYEFSESEKEKITEIVQKRVKTDEPLQYILGFAYFMGEKYCVDKNVLIPRPETEILVTEASKLIDKESKILDIGIGSGCISIALSKITHSVVDGVDISEKAILIAEKNRKNHNVNCNFFKSDLFENIKSKYDLIISNPPYIPLSEMNNLENNVKNYEPHAALFANDEFGIEFYEKIIKQAVTYLNTGGHIAFEIGIGQSSKIIELLNNFGYSDIKIIKDFSEIDRILIAKFS